MTVKVIDLPLLIFCKEEKIYLALALYLLEKQIYCYQVSQQVSDGLQIQGRLTLLILFLQIKMIDKKMMPLNQ